MNVLDKSFAKYCPSQQLQILRMRLDFLRRCRFTKRPPPSLRISGASSLSNASKFFRFSCLESDLLETAIRNKLDEIATCIRKNQIRQYCLCSTVQKRQPKLEETF